MAAVSKVLRFLDEPEDGVRCAFALVLHAYAYGYALTGGPGRPGRPGGHSLIFDDFSYCMNHRALVPVTLSMNSFSPSVDHALGRRTPCSAAFSGDFIQDFHTN